MTKAWALSFWHKAQFLNVLAVLLLLTALTVLALAGVSWVKRHAWFDIKEIVITGMRGDVDVSHQAAINIKKNVLPRLAGNFFTADLTAIQHGLSVLPWYRHAEVRRVWPNRIWVVLEEHQAVAKLNDDLLIDAQGEAFFGVSDDRWQKLPQFYGDKDEIALIQAKFQDLNAWLSPVQLSVKQLSFSERRAWTAVLSNNMVLDMGRDDLQPSMHTRVLRWVNTWGTAQKTANLPAGARIDLRYPNGYAVSRSVL